MEKREKEKFFQRSLQFSSISAPRAVSPGGNGMLLLLDFQALIGDSIHQKVKIVKWSGQKFFWDFEIPFLLRNLN